MNLSQFRNFIVRPTLEYLEMYSVMAEKLLLATIAHESHGRYIDQITSSEDNTLGPAIGLYQIEPATHDDLVNNFLNYRTPLRNRLFRLRAPFPDVHVQLASNLAYATGVARLIYYRDSQPLPEEGEEQGLWKYYKRVWNTPLGAAREEDWWRSYWEMVAPLYVEVVNTNAETETEPETEAEAKER